MSRMAMMRWYDQHIDGQQYMVKKGALPTLLVALYGRVYHKNTFLPRLELLAKLPNALLRCCVSEH